MFGDKIFNKIQLKRKKVVTGDNFRIIGKIMVHGNGTIRIGDNVTIISDPNVNPVAGGIRTHLRSEGGCFRLVIM